MEFQRSIFEQQFREINVRGDGNCLFNTVSYLLNGNERQHNEIRHNVCEFYKHFDFRVKNHEDENTPAFKLKMLYSTDDRYDDNHVEHKVNICRPTVWGSLSDIYVICIIYNINIVLCQLYGQSYNLLECNPGVHPTHYILLKNQNHYQPLVSKDRTRSRTRSRTRTSTRTLKNLTQDYDKAVEKYKSEQKIIEQLQRLLEQKNKSKNELKSTMQNLASKIDVLVK